MRILTDCATLSPLGGIELSTVQDAVALSERGHDLSLLYGSDGPLRAQYEAAGVALRGPVEFSVDPKRLARDTLALLPSMTWARSRKPDVVWLNRFEHIFWGQAVARSARCILVCQLHHIPNYRRVHLLSRGVAHFVAVSQFMREVWIESGLEAERISVVHNAVSESDYPYGGEPERRSARVLLNLDSERPVVLYYGRMTSEKGVRTLLQAWRQVQLKSTDAMLMLVGSSSPDGDLGVKLALAQLSRDVDVRWLPDQLDVVPALHAADVVVFPSELPEAFGRVVVEAMLTGRPVVASRSGAIPEILPGSWAEFLFDPGSTEQLAARLSGLLDWRLRRPSLGAECAAMVRRRFDYGAHLEGLEDVFERYRRRG